MPPGGGDAELVVAEKEFEQPNGLCFSPDESILYVNDRQNLKAYDVAPDGSLVRARLGRRWTLDETDYRTGGPARYFTVRESARLQTFPDWYHFPSSWTESMRQIGNAVPVTLARVIGASVGVTLGEHQRRIARNQ